MIEVAKDALAELCQAGGQIDDERSLADAALVIDEGNSSCHRDCAIPSQDNALTMRISAEPRESKTWS
jgi:hypothetical protein